jgi:hypothetical protein
MSAGFQTHVAPRSVPDSVAGPMGRRGGEPTLHALLGLTECAGRRRCPGRVKLSLTVRARAPPRPRNGSANCPFGTRRCRAWVRGRLGPPPFFLGPWAAPVVSRLQAC